MIEFRPCGGLLVRVIGPIIGNNAAYGRQTIVRIAWQKDSRRAHWRGVLLGSELRFIQSLAHAMSKKQVGSEGIAVQTESMRLRCELMAALKQHLEHVGMNQAKAAAALGVTQPRISDLMRRKIALFSLDTLVEMAAAAGLQVKIRATKAL